MPVQIQSECPLCGQRGLHFCTAGQKPHPGYSRDVLPPVSVPLPSVEPAQPGIDAILEEPLERFREAVIALENATSQDDHVDGWGEALMAASEVETALEQLQDEIRRNLKDRE